MNFTWLKDVALKEKKNMWRNSGRQHQSNEPPADHNSCYISHDQLCDQSCSMMYKYINNKLNFILRDSHKGTWTAGVAGESEAEEEEE